MKSSIQKIVVLLILFSCLSYSQSISFYHPLNGQSYTEKDAPRTSTESAIWVWLSYTYNITPYPPRVSLYNYVKLITPNGTWSTLNGGQIPDYHSLPSGNYTWTLELYEFFMGGQDYEKTANKTITFSVKNTLKVQNNFTIGSIMVDNVSVSSGSESYKLTGQTLPVGAIDQSDGTYNRIWNNSGTNNSNWIRAQKNQSGAPIQGAIPRNYNYTVVSNDNGATITSDMKKLYAVTLQTEKGTTINVNGNNFTSPYSTNVVEVNKLYL
ncbi:MAG: hypothetical protein NTX22_07620, partial [Ignavibacteriales bacterium]|nr:hypothetical protein [Ignavibacteriales bacterium]